MCLLLDSGTKTGEPGGGTRKERADVTQPQTYFLDDLHHTFLTASYQLKYILIITYSVH